MLSILCHLHTVYPGATLSDCIFYFVWQHCRRPNLKLMTQRQTYGAVFLGKTAADVQPLPEPAALHPLHTVVALMHILLHMQSIKTDIRAGGPSTDVPIKTEHIRQR